MPVAADQRKKKTVYVNMKPKDIQKASSRWWLLDKDKIHEGVWSVCEYILTNMAVRRRMNYFFAALYNDTGAQFMASRNVNLYYNRTALDGNAVLSSNLTVNTLQNIIDTACSLIATSKPKPQFITNGAESYELKVKGKELTDFIAGVFEDMNLYDITQRVFLDACIYGTGAIKLYMEDGQPKAENMFIEELLVDDLEGMHEKPLQLHQRKYIPRDQVIAKFPQYKEYILGAEEVSGGAATFSTADIIPVIESWHLPSSKKSKDGLHCISINNCTLFSEPYNKDNYPILFFRWAYQTLGFWGRGICHEIWKIQRARDLVEQTIQRSQRLQSGPIIAVEAGSNISEAHITSNRLAKIVEYSVTPPQFLTPPAVNPELYQQCDRYDNYMYASTGMSRSQATGDKPADVKSAVAMREVADIAQGRYSLAAQRYERYVLDITRKLVDILQDEGEDISTMISAKGIGKKISFKDVNVDIKNYKLQLFPISGLPSTPAGRLDTLMEYAQNGYLNKEQVMDVADFPDLEDTVSLETSSIRLVQKILSNIKLQGQKGYMPPQPYMNLQEAFRLSSLEVDRSMLQGVDEKNIDLIRKWTDECSELMQTANQQTAQQTAPQPQLAQPQQAPMQQAPMQQQQQEIPQ